jgi:glycosyltransferase involved in cell wall biosynthesis
MRGSTETPSTASVIIPTLNCREPLRRLLASLKPFPSPVVEVIVVDGGSSDGTAKIAQDLGARVLLEAGDRSLARNRGWRAARAEALIFLDSDMAAAPGLVIACLRALGSADALVIPERTETGGNLWAEARSLERDAPGSEPGYAVPRVYRLPLLLAAGGFDPSMTGLEDVDLRERIRVLGARIATAPTLVTHDESRVGVVEYLAKRARYGRADRRFAERHPSAWAVMRAPFPRLSVAARAAHSKGIGRGMLLLTALGMQRMVEYFVRSSLRFVHPSSVPGDRGRRPSESRDSV